MTYSYPVYTPQLTDSLMTDSLSSFLQPLYIPFFVSSADIADLINHGHADIGLIYSDTSFIKDIELCYIGSVPFVAVVSPEHPLSNFTSLSASQLMRHRQLMIKGLYHNRCQFPLPFFLLQYGGLMTTEH